MPTRQPGFLNFGSHTAPPPSRHDSYSAHQSTPSVLKHCFHLPYSCRLRKVNRLLTNWGPCGCLCARWSLCTAWIPNTFFQMSNIEFQRYIIQAPFMTLLPRVCVFLLVALGKVRILSIVIEYPILLTVVFPSLQFNTYKRVVFFSKIIQKR